MTDSMQLSETIKTLAAREGFACAAITTAGAVEHKQLLMKWLSLGYNADMAYMAANVAKRLRPELLVKGARSVICLAVSYAPAPENHHAPHDNPTGDGGMPASNKAFIARYCRGRDYHKVLKRRCRNLMDRIRNIAPDLEARAFVDTAPVAERSLAAAAGIGWIGRNGLLIAPGLGSYVCLCEIVCNLELSPDTPIASRCGDCDACITACPTGALAAEGLVNAGRCISYLTIEHRGQIDSSLWPLMGTSVLGCDACQEVCPHNRNAPAGDVELRDTETQEELDLADILAWSESDWDHATRGRARRRAKLDMFLRNAVIAAGNTTQNAGGTQRLTKALKNLLRRRSDLAELIEWALQRLASRVNGDTNV